MFSSHLPSQLWSASFLAYKHSEWRQNVRMHPSPHGVECCTVAPLTLASLSADRKMRDQIKLAARKWRKKNKQNNSAYLFSISLHLSPQIPCYFASWYHVKIQRWNYQWPEAVSSSDLIQTPIHEKYPTFCEH